MQSRQSVTSLPRGAPVAWGYCVSPLLVCVCVLFEVRNLLTKVVMLRLRLLKPPVESCDSLGTQSSETPLEKRQSSVETILQTILTDSLFGPYGACRFGPGFLIASLR